MKVIYQLKLSNFKKNTKPKRILLDTLESINILYEGKEMVPKAFNISITTN